MQIQTLAMSNAVVSMLAPAMGAEVARALVFSGETVSAKTVMADNLSFLEARWREAGLDRHHLTNALVESFKSGLAPERSRQLLLEIAARFLKGPSFHAMAPSRLWDPSWNTRALWKSGERSEAQTRLLREIIEKVRRTPNAVVVLDIDDTPYASFFRKAVILREYGFLAGLQPMQHIQPEEANSWDSREILLINLRMDERTIGVHIDPLVQFLHDRLFSSAYVLLDQPLPGAPEFVQELCALGAHIFYITGRDETNMRDGTLATLRRDGFPIDQPKTTLICKPHPIFEGLPSDATQAAQNEHIRESDITYKTSMFKIPHEAGTVVLYLDNEPGQIRRWQTLYPAEAGAAVWMNTAYSPFSVPLPPETPILHGFLT